MNEINNKISIDETNNNEMNNSEINNVEKVGASTAVAWPITPKTKPPRIDCTRPVSYTKRPPKKTPTKAPIRKLLTILSMS